MQDLSIGTSAYEVVLALHIAGALVAFGSIFAFPIMFALARRQDHRSLPLMHRIERMIERVLINGGLLIVVGAGAYLATAGKDWSRFFVDWGLGAAIVIGGLVGSVMIPASRRAEAAVSRDVEKASEGELELSDEYRRLARRLTVTGLLCSALVLATIFIMVLKP